MNPSLEEINSRMLDLIEPLPSFVPSPAHEEDRRLTIVGAGMAGLICAQMAKRAGFNVIVLEQQDRLPDNHGAVLRFRSDAVSLATGIPFRKVRVLKSIVPSDGSRSCQTDATLADINRYSLKVTGQVMPRSAMNLAPADRWIAPDDFCERLAKGIDIQFGTRFDGASLNDATSFVISTMPMPLLMDIIGMKDNRPSFEYRDITTVTVDLGPKVDVHQTMYFPHHEMPWYRVSITGNKMIIEGIGHLSPIRNALDLSDLLEWFGLAGLNFDAFKMYQYRVEKYQQYGKLIPGDEALRRHFILHASSQLQVYSLGRFATWRQLLLDDLVKDVHWILRAISDTDHYTQRLRSVLP